jgi:polyisoprenoid-binding protein YceI
MTILKSTALAFGGAMALSAAIMGGGAHAQATNSDFKAVQAGDYVVETHHTRVLFSVAHMGFSTWYGDFTGVKGTARINPADPAADALDVTIPTASVLTTNETLDDELKSPDWFDAAKYPTITFKSRQFTVIGPDKGQVTGDLTFHGVTRPVTLNVSFNGSGANPMTKTYTTGFEVSGKIRRSDFGVAKYVPIVGDDVTLIISAAFEKKAS